MFLHRLPPRRPGASGARAIVRRLTSGGTALGLLFLVACGGGSPGPDDNGGDGTLTGTVRTAEGAAAIEGATISVGTQQATTDASGHFELADLDAGEATVRAERPGYVPAEATVTISAGANTHDFALTAQEIYESGTYAVYVPAGVGPLRGAIIALGGPPTRGFVDGGTITSESPELEQSLQALGTSLRAVAKSARVALLGTTIEVEDSPLSDDALFNALATAAGASGHAELTDAPVLMFGLSAGLESGGLASRVPERTIGVLMRVPQHVPALTAPSALAVPTFVMQAEMDAFVNNASVRATFSENRSRGGLWALAVEPGIVHNQATAEGNAANVAWIAMALELRLPATPGDPLIALDESSGWLGNPTTLEIATWADYAGDRTAASWLLSESVALSWQTLGTDAGGGGGAAGELLVP